MPSNHSVRPASARAQLLSNGRYHVMMGKSGSGWSRWSDLAVTRWREDATVDATGTFIYLRDIASAAVWSATLQPTCAIADESAVEFAEDGVVYRRRDHGIGVETRIIVAATDDCEVRRVRVDNLSASTRTIELTSYAEVVIGGAAADSAHPAFSKLFVATEWLADAQAILCRRRARSAGEPNPWMFHRLLAHGATDGAVSFETDCARFIGRGRDVSDPLALENPGDLSGTAGAVLDPVVALRCRVTLEPGARADFDFITGAAESREACVALIEKYREREATDRAFAAEPAHAAAFLARLGIDPSAAATFARFAAALVTVDRNLRGDAQAIAANRRGQSSLWRYSISGDLPIVLANATGADDAKLVGELAHAHAYCRAKGLAFDLVVVCADAAACERLVKVIADSGGADCVDKSGGFFVRASGDIDDAEHILLQAIARVVLRADAGTLSDQLDRSANAPQDFTGRRAQPARPTRSAPNTRGSAERWSRALRCFNGCGGFSADGREYVMQVDGEHMTPAPWINVMANPDFGSLVSECGSANTWSENAQAFRLTPWSNDPVGDANTEAFYVRDEDSGRFWSPTPLPCGRASPTLVRHGFGYSVFARAEDGIESELTLFVATDAPIKYAVLKLRNRSGRARRLSITGYVEWVLGGEREKTQMHIVTARDNVSGAVLARNAYNTDFAGQCAFFDVDAGERSVCGDRARFIGRNGALAGPAALSQTHLSGTLGAALDPCAAIRCLVDLADGAGHEIVFRLGAAADEKALRTLLDAPRDAPAAHAALEAVHDFWHRTLGAVQVRTADPALDVLANGWLIYQILSCRLWGRTAFYQSSGAYGFRDQLQDVMALVHAAPGEVRAHLLRSAGRQFPEGDVQHWWHPPSGRGIRTRCSDDYLWLPFATCRYVECSGDSGVLDQDVPFIGGRALKDGEESDYALPEPCSESATLYEHCKRAVVHGLRFGAHGLPLMGTGDWNDGMNLVGAGGKGESVWLAFFLRAVLARFGDLARSRGDGEFATRCAIEAKRLDQAIDACAWDGAWYQRAWFDDGSPLGTAANEECRIDSVAQSWSVLCGRAVDDRARRALASVRDRLVHADSALVQLLDPPFNHSDPDPGYIQGYLPGVRENGGQYTHAAVWVAMAFAALGDAKGAWSLLGMLNPVNHADSESALAIWRTEPYVLASDVYSKTPHVGRGGWTWYTGSAGWMYQFITESLLGLRRDGTRLHFAPCLPPGSAGFGLDYRHGRTLYRIELVQAAGADADSGIRVDGRMQAEDAIVLVDDGREHQVEIRLPRTESPEESP